MRSALFEHMQEKLKSEPAPQNLDKLDDATIDDLYHRTLSEYARNLKRQSRVLV